MYKILTIIFSISILQVPQLKAVLQGNPPRFHVSYQVPVFRNDHLRCGGSILDEYTILTAASCVADYPMEREIVSHGFGKNRQSLTQIYIRVGSNSVNNHDSVIYGVDDVKIHPKFSPRDYDYDVALMKLKKPLGSIGSPNWNKVLFDHSTAPEFGQRVIIRGWGTADLIIGRYKTNVLLEASLKVMPEETCRKSFGSKKYNPKTMFCAIGVLKENACSGDAGNPILSSGGTQIGVTSFISCEEHIPSYYTRLDNYDIWNWVQSGKLKDWPFVESYQFPRK